MGLAREVYILFPALALLCITRSSAENGRCQKGPKDDAHGIQSVTYEDSTHVYQYGIPVQPYRQSKAPPVVWDNLIKANATQQETENVGKDNKVKKLPGTPSLNRSRPIAWLDDHNVSTTGSN